MPLGLACPIVSVRFFLSFLTLLLVAYDLDVVGRRGEAEGSCSPVADLDVLRVQLQAAILTGTFDAVNGLTALAKPGILVVLDFKAVCGISRTIHGSHTPGPSDGKCIVVSDLDRLEVGINEAWELEDITFCLKYPIPQDVHTTCAGVGISAEALLGHGRDKR